jgi:hypothetical protein
MKKKENEVPRQVLSYSPNRLEYFAGLALQGLIVGRSEKDIRKAARTAVELARELEKQIDS